MIVFINWLGAGRSRSGLDGVVSYCRTGIIGRYSFGRPWSIGQSGRGRVRSSSGTSNSEVAYFSSARW